ncbi:uncharacterized protein LOC133721505 [Rosa rugosa]|uniref:uncharacterized protein LOC133721505 n=1 Tax=Rosa rugosa TaxID=74645 RepID=UPI002B41419F|nr:uncharacterized protein LOC133721505 [Rosa rugosa]XP_062004119.1 uncharacterized protein LOC133721505 [Rosa rugosa]
MSLTLISCGVELEMDLKTQSDLKELKLGAGIEPVWKTRSWPASQEQKFQRPAAIGFWENFVYKARTAAAVKIPEYQFEGVNKSSNYQSLKGLSKLYFLKVAGDENDDYSVAKFQTSWI